MQQCESKNWYEANQHYLITALEGVRNLLLNKGSGTNQPLSIESSFQDNLDGLARAMEPAPALEILCKTFGLSIFERHLLLLCSGMELDTQFAALCAEAHVDRLKIYPTFSLAMAKLPEPHWSALTPTAPLRYWRLLEIGSGSALTLSPLRIDERILNYLAGVQHLDGRLVDFLESIDETVELVPSHHAIVTQVLRLWCHHNQNTFFPIIQFTGPEVQGKRAIAVSLSNKLGMKFHVMASHFIPIDQNEFSALLRLLTREFILCPGVLFLDCDDLDGNDSVRDKVILKFIESFKGAMIISSRDLWRLQRRPFITFDIKKPIVAEQLVLWQAILGDLTPKINGQLEKLVAQFHMNIQTIKTVATEAKMRITDTVKQSNPDGNSKILWDTCRVHLRPRLNELAQYIEPTAYWNDLVLPEQEKQILRDIAVHLRQRIQVYEHWGFATKCRRGLGISALFAGPSGTGKTMAAEVLAHEFELDLYRIDLSAVVSKYIGETEKNLRRVFDAAENSGVILLFDEADALFGKRSEVKDSHDRYANIEVSYLLQRMESYRGLAILTTNRKSALDSAFLRRIRFIVNFPFPDLQQRIEIWQRIFPNSTPTEKLDMHKLAQLNITGGNIRNIAMNAAFLAAEAGQPVRMCHLLHSAKSEYIKIEKSLTETEVRGWV